MWSLKNNDEAAAPRRTAYIFEELSLWHDAGSISFNVSAQLNFTFTDWLCDENICDFVHSCAIWTDLDPAWRNLGKPRHCKHSLNQLLIIICLVALYYTFQLFAETTI